MTTGDLEPEIIRYNLCFDYKYIIFECLIFQNKLLYFDRTVHNIKENKVF